MTTPHKITRTGTIDQRGNPTQREIVRLANTTHGMHGTATYKSWEGMIQRCTKPSHKNWISYGGRGITVCPEWLKFESFLSDMGASPEGMTLERVKNDLGYSPDNCRWATRRDQCNNRRSNVFVEYKGKTQTVQMWSRELGMNYRTLGDRLRRGWPIERAIETPASRTNKKYKPNHALHS